MSQRILGSLNLEASNSGSYLGQGEWSKTNDAGMLTSINPASNETIAEVHASSSADYERIVERAEQAF